MNKLDYAVTNITDWIGRSESDDKRIPMVLEHVRKTNACNLGDAMYLCSIGIPMADESHIDIRKMRDGNTPGYTYLDLCEHLISVSDKWGRFGEVAK